MKNTLVLFLSFSLLASACSKKPVEKTATSTTTTTVTDKTKLNSLFAAFRSSPQKLSVTAGTTQTVSGAKGTKLTFYPNSFKDANGKTITSGTIDLELIEMYKPGDMIANRATTLSKNRLLVSGGQIYVNATKNGKTVAADKYGISYANAASGNGMALYLGNSINEDSVVTWGDPLASGGTSCVTATVDTSTSPINMRYKFDSCTDFGWVNCDRFYSDPVPKTNMYLTTNENTFNFTNSQVFVVFPELNATALLYYYDGTTRRFGFLSDPAYGFPIGLKAHFIVMANKNGKYYYFEKLNQTITENILIDAREITERSEDYIKERLSAL